MTALARPRPFDPRTRLGRVRATAAVGGLAVLLSGAVAVHQPAAPALSAVTSATAGLSGATAHLGAVARTGGQR